MIKALLLPFILIGFFSVSGIAMCENEPVFNTADSLAAKTFRLNKKAEISLTITAVSPQTAWGLRKAEASAITIFIDGKYNQDVLLFAGDAVSASRQEKGFPYRVFLGEMSKGDHRIDITFNKERSARNAVKAKIENIRIEIERPATFKSANSGDQVKTRENNDENKKRYWAKAYAPFIYARPNAIDKFTDIPLVMYSEIFSEEDETTRIRYTVIFSHEDGGTQAKALMARWGRMTDIEWIYEVRFDKEGAVIAETFQGANHVTGNFSGKRLFGLHPLLYTVTDNNNFSDDGCSQLRFGVDPVIADLSATSRETIMEKFPWTYRIMAEEMLREDRIALNSSNENKVEDPRDYIYAEIYSEPDSAAVSFEAVMQDDRIFSSDRGIAALRVARQGFLRIALHIPHDIADNAIKNFSVRCHAAVKNVAGKCENVRLLKIVRLGKDFLPHEKYLHLPPQTINIGEAAFFPPR